MTGGKQYGPVVNVATAVIVACLVAVLVAGTVRVVAFLWP